MTSHGCVCQGANSYGQLGHGDAEDRPAPRLCDTAGLGHKAVRVVTGGGGHTAVVTGKIQVYGLLMFSQMHNFNQDQWIIVYPSGHPVLGISEPLAPPSGQKIMCDYFVYVLKRPLHSFIINKFSCNYL